MFFLLTLLLGTHNANIESFAVPAGHAITVPFQNSSGPPCLSYEPSVELSGTIVRKTFPGPPNYTSVRQGDRPETAWLLELSQPICIDENTRDPDLNPAQKGVRRIQLVFSDPKVYSTQKDLVGKQVIARGSLFGAHTGHHHTPVLMMVSTLKSVVAPNK